MKAQVSLRPFSLILLSLLALTGLRGEEALSLAGKWRFSRDSDKVGLAEKWYAQDLKTQGGGPTEISLPGTTDEAGAGLPNPKMPNLDGLYRPNVYTGPAWYQREIDIPESWRGKRLSLFLERTHWVTRAWLDEQDLGAKDSLISPHTHDLGMEVAPGRHRLTVCVDNTLKLDLGAFVSIYYEGTQTNWNGIIGAIELRADDPVALTDVEVYPDVDHQQIEVQARMSNFTGGAVTGRLQFSLLDQATGAAGAPMIMAVNSAPGESAVSAKVPMGDHPGLWDEFSPHLYTLRTALATSQPSFKSEKNVTFGLRQFATRGTQFTMNGRPLFLRGTLECGIFPLTGCPPTDIAAWDRIYKIMKSYGLNMIRFHSWCPPDAAFVAADQDGIMIQVEGPQANTDAGRDQNRDAFLGQELKRMVDTYGNHPSFCLMTLGNEYGGPDQVINGWLDMLAQEDPRHLYSQPSWDGDRRGSHSQWYEGGGDGLGDEDGRGVRGPGTENDAHEAIAHLKVPLQGHEIGQWAIYPNFDEIKKYTGVLQAKNFELIRDDLQAKGMGDEGASFFQATGQESRLLYKEEIEVLMRTPNYAGFSLLDLHDYPGQGTALVGMLDPFWDSKGLVTPEDYRHYFGPTVPLLRFPKRVYASDEKFSAQLDVAQFGPVDLTGIVPDWTISDAKGQTVGSGSFPSLDLPTGKLTRVEGEINAPLAAAEAPSKLTVTVSLRGTPFSNNWNIWVYPPPATVEIPENIVVSHSWDEARLALAQGKRVILFPDKFAAGQTLAGSFKPVFWSPVWFHFTPSTMGILCNPKLPLFSQFPTDFFSDWQWWNLIEGSKTMILNGTPPGFRPLVQVIDNFSRNDKLADVFEGRVGAGSLLVCSLNLRDRTSPETAQFLRSLYGYVDSDAFHPETELSTTFLDSLLEPKSVLKDLGARIMNCDSEAKGYAAVHAIDGDVDSIWHTQYDPTPAPLPHFLAIDLGKTVQLKGITYLPRQDSTDGRVGDCEVYLSDDPNNWGEPVATTRLADTEKTQVILFNVPSAGRYLKFVAKSSLNGKPYISVAELNAVPQ